MRGFILTILTLLVFFITAQFLLKDKINLFGEIRDRIFGRSASQKTTFIVKVKKNTPPHFMQNSTVGAWMNNVDKNKIMIEIYKTGKRGHADRRLDFYKPIDLAADSNGSAFVLGHSYGRIVEITPQGNFKRFIYLRQDSESPFQYPHVLAFTNNQFYVVDETQTVIVLDYPGKEIRRFKTNYDIYDLAVDQAGFIYVLTPADSFRLHKFTAKGLEILAFSPQEEKEKELWKIFARGRIAIGPDNSVYYSLEYPYKIYKYSPDGKPVLGFGRDLAIALTPPTIHRQKGKIISVNRQQYSYDIKIASNNIVMNLIKTRGSHGGDAIDLFSYKGKYLQSLYLARNYRHLALVDSNDIILQLPRPTNTVERYKIEKMRMARNIHF
ncbi:MAG: hypothetical protein GXO75_00580 [Calditrichaeota bacterium]|nr:hypothetical protein [Calditrichota bacterium]